MQSQNLIAYYMHLYILDNKYPSFYVIQWMKYIFGFRFVLLHIFDQNGAGIDLAFDFRTHWICEGMKGCLRCKVK